MARSARILLVACALVAALVSACSPRTSAAPSRVGAAAAPAAPDLSTPESAVRSYLDWTSFAYRAADSDAASRTATAEAVMRVDAYVQLNREKGQGIEQRLVAFGKRSERVEETSAVLAAREEWRYRYFDLDTLRYRGPEHGVSYETTYTLVKQGSRWLVDEVRAKPLGDVK